MRFSLRLSVFLILFASPSFSQDAVNESFSQPQSEALLSGDLFSIPLQDFEFMPIPEISEEEFQELLPQDLFLRDLDEEPMDIEPSLPDEVLRGAVPVDVTKFPYSTGGALFFTQNGGNYRCSAQFVGDGSVLLTAAHCVRDSATGNWNTRTAFYRAYANGTGDYYSVQCMATKQGWVTGGNGRYKWDYAFIKVNGNSSGGILGYRTGVPYNNFESIGYAGNCGGGRTMHSASGTKGVVSNNIVQMRGNPCTQGHSGGAWIGASRYAIGTNSFIYRNRPNEMYGPLFDNNTSDLYRYALRGCQ